MKNKIIWTIFLVLGFIILILDTPLNWKYLRNFSKELKEVLKKHSKYSEDGDFTLIHKKDLFKFHKRKKL